MLWLHVASEDWRNNIFTVILSWLAFLAWNDNNILFHLCPALLQQNEMLKNIWGIHRGPTFRPGNFTLSVPLLSSIVIIVRRKGRGLWDYCLFLPWLFHISYVSFSACVCSYTRLRYYYHCFCVKYPNSSESWCPWTSWMFWLFHILLQSHFAILKLLVFIFSGHYPSDRALDDFI